ncbi:prepilin peptidase [Candidatus Poriferisodalis sp.]|uniref:prepilin peptidase n=1 Tax=Candidatus Poriferisodalis sp. TaxID=3101277 RepID=UPI003B0194E6
MTWAAALVYAAAVVWFASAAALSVIDWRTRLLPTRLIWPAAAAVWVLYGIASALRGTPSGLLGALGGALACSAPLLVIHVIHPASMGFGDVRFSVLNGLVCGWWGWHVALAGLALSFVAALPEALAVMARHGPRSSRPLGPYLALGTAAATAWALLVLGAVPEH